MTPMFATKRRGMGLAVLRKPFAIIAALLMLMTLVIPALAHNPAPGPFYDTWARTDKPVADGVVDRTFVWGPDALEDPRMEPYAESPGGMRQVQYFEKARMEINDPNAPNDGLWFVTNGLLVVELMTGRMQVGDTSFEDHQPADINIAGDPGYVETPTYATYGMLMDAAAWPQGAVITATVAADGTVGDAPGQAQFNVTAGPLSPETGHRTASVFWNFMTSTGLVHRAGQTVNEALFLNPYYATGLPITEAYWAEIMVAGSPQWVLTQAFERRVLTYTPSNQPGWQVEAGNVGWHYWQWRYGMAQDANDQFFYAELNTAQEVPQPQVPSNASGDAVVFVNGAGTLSYELIVVDIQNVSAAHIHLAMPGETGPVVATLFMGSFSTGSGGTGTLVTGMLTSADLEGPLAGMTLDDLLHEMEHGNTYINVHTTQNPAGEIRGQLELLGQ
jgi:hypothetical protein